MALSRDELKLLLEKQTPALRAFAAAATRGSGDADEVVQETLFRALRHAGQLRDSAKMLPWLKGIARNVIREAAAKTRRRAAAAQKLAVREDSREERHVFDAIEQFMPLLLPYASRQDVLITLALKFCLGWKPREIAAIVMEKNNTVQRRLREAELRFQRRQKSTEAIDPHAILDLKNEVCILLNRLATHPLHGKAFRNLRLLHDVTGWIQTLRRQYPDDWYTQRTAAMLLFTAGRMREYTDDMQPPPRPWECDRSRWDRTLISEAAAICRRLPALNCQADSITLMDIYRRFYAAPAWEAVDWAACHRDGAEFLKRQPNASFHVFHSYSVYALKGPLAAARYLVGMHRHRRVGEWHVALYQIADYYFVAEKWKEARQYFKASLRRPWNLAFREWMSGRIAECTARMAAARRK